jgi:hypothetical protein
MNKEIIIAKYKEDLSWVNNLKEFKLSVYDKSDETNNHIKLENKGRESDTYLNHIIKNYNNLSDINIFTQGHPFDHCPNIFDLIHNNNYTSLGSNIVCDKYGNPHHYGIPLIDVWYEISKKEIPEVIEFTPGAMFIVEKKQILQHDICFYEKILELHDKYEQMPWVIERLWDYIWCNKL